MLIKLQNVSRQPDWALPSTLPKSHLPTLKRPYKYPGLTRLGHATHAAYHPHLLEKVARSGVTIECSLTCNVILGAAPSYEAHPIRRFVEAGIPVALCTDDPVQMGTTIGREYAVAHALGIFGRTITGFHSQRHQSGLYITCAAKRTIVGIGC